MAMVEIDALSSQPLDAARLLGFSLDAPRPGTQSDTFGIEIEGWVLGREQKVERVEVFLDGACVGSTAVWLPRGDLATLFPNSPQAAEAGFRVNVNVLGLPEQFTLTVHAVLADQATVPLGQLRARHAPLRPEWEPRRQPLLVTAVGRSGSTWLMRLLSEHPEIVVHCGYPFEPVAAWYLMQTLRVLTTPSNPVHHSDRRRVRESAFAAYPMPFYCREEEPGLQNWLRTDYVKRWASFTVEMIEGFYDRVAELRGRPSARYYCEKALGITTREVHVSAIFAELYPRLREVFLVRDFRDLVCSRRIFFSRRKPKPLPVEEFVEDLVGRGQTLLAHWQGRRDRAHLVRYEDLIREPIPTLRRLFDFLGLDQDVRLVQAILASASENSGISTSHKTASDPLSSIGRFRRELDERQQELCQQRLGGLLEVFGYGKAA